MGRDIVSIIETELLIENIKKDLGIVTWTTIRQDELLENNYKLLMNLKETNIVLLKDLKQILK